MSKSKFGCLVNGVNEQSHDYGNTFFEQPCGSSSRLVIGPSADQVEILISLSALLRGNPWFFLYVLLLSRQGIHQAGRYQSEPYNQHSDLARFMRDFREFFESDGRHHVWIGSAQNDGLLVYDQHNVIFAYGLLEAWKDILRNRHFRETHFWFPVPHAHHYHPENDSEEARLIACQSWEQSPLKKGDEWD